MLMLMIVVCTMNYSRYLCVISYISYLDNVENSLMSIFDEPEEKILAESYANINNSLIIDPDSNSSTTISEEIIGLSSLQTFEFSGK